MSKIPGRGSQDGRHIVVGLDAGKASRHALDTAAELASQLPARLDVVHVVDLKDFPVDPDAPDWEERMTSAVDEERDWARDHLASWAVSWDFHLRRGEPALAISALALEVHASMVVVGSYGEGIGPMMHRVFSGGSVGHRLVSGRRFPVLVVPWPRSVPPPP